MALVPLEIAPGVYANGTDMQATGRWLDASLVRWTDGTMRPVGGWSDRGVTPLGAAVRGAHAWRDNSGDRWLAVGTFDALRVISASSILTDITPVGLTTGLESAAVNSGFGGGFFGVGFYGTARTGINFSDATTWSMDNWGEYLVACSVSDGGLYEWQLDTAGPTPAAAISGAPTGCLGLVVTPERFLFALGAGSDPRKVAWSDKEDNTTWTAAATNEAGDFRLPIPGQIMCGKVVRGQTIILSDYDAWAATYNGPPFVYGFERVGSACGVVSRNAATAVNGALYWMGDGSFYVYSGGSVQELPSDVSDLVFSNLNSSQRSKVYAVANTEFNEVCWFYPVSTECDRYVTYNYQEGHWSTGMIDRTAGVDRGVFGKPVWVSSGGTIYDHETGLNHDGALVYAESGPISMGAGDSVVNVTHLLPDEEAQGDVTATFKTRFYPQGDEYIYGPYTMSAPTSVRFTGRQVRVRVEGATLSDWRWGIPRIDAKPMGRR